MTIEELLKSYDWAEVFGEGSGGNTTREIEAVPPGAEVSTALVNRSDVVEIIASSDGENDERDWVGLFLLTDGRFLVATGSCDYTGWDCQAGNDLSVSATREDAIRFGLDETQRVRLGLTL